MVGAIIPVVRVTALEVRVLAAMLLAMPLTKLGCRTALLRRPVVAIVGTVVVYIQ